MNFTHRPNDPDVSQAFIDLTKYAQTLEHMVRFKNREIQRLEYLNKYLVISQQKRDEMLTHTLEENRKLKEHAVRNEKKYAEKRQKGPAAFGVVSPNSKTNKVLFKAGTSHGPNSNEERYHGKKSIFLHAGDTQKANTKKQSIKYVDDKKSQSILKMSKLYYLY